MAATRTTSNLREISSAISRGPPGPGRARPGAEPAGPLQVVYHADQVLDEEPRPDRDLLSGGGPVEGTGEVTDRLAGGPGRRHPPPRPLRRDRPAYHTVSGWVQDHGHELAGGPREVYLNDPGQVAEADLETEVQWPIR